MASPTTNPPFLPKLKTYYRHQFPNEEQYSNALLGITKQAQFTILHCPRHLSQLPSSFSTTATHRWCILLQCETCDFCWSICSECPNVWSRMTKKGQCNRHNAKFHSVNLPQEIPPAPPAPLFMHQLPLPPPPPPQVSPPPHMPMSIVPQFSRIESHNYFINNQHGHLGPASLVSLAHFKNRISAHRIPPQEVYNQILIAHHASDLTKGQKKHFSHLLFNLFKSNSHTSTITLQKNNPFIPSIPTAFSEVRSKYTEGPNSIVMNLPYPAIRTNVPGHSYVQISDVIEDFLAHGFLPLQPCIRQSEDWISNLCQSPVLVRNIQKAIQLYGNVPFFSWHSKNGRMTTSLSMLGKTAVQFGVKTSPF
jgi:hypothetical protein